MAFRREATARLKNGALGLSVFLIVTLIWPLPSLPYSLYLVFLRLMGQAQSSPAPHILHWAEFLVASVFVLNISQSALALRFPPKAIPVRQTPAKQTMTPSKGGSAKRLTGLSPSVTARGQLNASSNSLSASGFYSPSNSTSISASGRQSQLGSSLHTRAAGSPSPSPVVSAYRGRLANSTSGRALDGSFLSQLSASVSDDEA